MADAGFGNKVMEAKQYPGFLKEQSRHYAAYSASIRLTAIRFCLVVIAQAPDQGLPGIRKQIATHATQIDFPARLWSFFRALIMGALEALKTQWGEVISQAMETIEAQVNRFFVQALQLDPRILRLEAVSIRGSPKNHGVK